MSKAELVLDLLNTNLVNPDLFGPYDWRGSTIRIGSRVIYSTRSGSSLDVIEGEVVEIIEGNDTYQWFVDNHTRAFKESGRGDPRVIDYYSKWLFKLRIQPLKEAGSWHGSSDRSKGKPVVITKVDCVTVVNKR
jgi:hypothetical protein